MYAGSTPSEIVQNVGRLAELSGNRICVVPPLAQQKFADLRQSLSAQDQPSYSPHVGWLYMPYDPNGGQDRWIVRDQDMPGGGKGKGKIKLGEDPDRMHCFGHGYLKCPNCKGSGQVFAGKEAKVVGTHSGGHGVGWIEKKFAKCSSCNGTGKVRCPDCVNGIDRNLADRHLEDLNSDDPQQDSQRPSKTSKRRRTNRVRIGKAIIVAFRSAKAAIFRGAKGDDAVVIDSPI